MSEAYLKEMLEYRKSSDAASMVKCRRRRIDSNGDYVPEKLRPLTRDQAEVELAQLRRRFAWDDDIAPRQLLDRLKILAGCGYYSVSHKAEHLIQFLPLRSKLLKVREEGDLQEDLWELLCFSLLDQRPYVLNADFWGRLDGKTVLLWKNELKEFRSHHSDLANACGTTLEEIESKVKELSTLAGSAKAGKDTQPVIDRLIEREDRRIRQQSRSFELSGSGHGSNNWQLILVGIFIVSGLVRGFMRDGSRPLSNTQADQLRNNINFATEQFKKNQEKLQHKALDGLKTPSPTPSPDVKNPPVDQTQPNPIMPTPAVDPGRMTLEKLQKQNQELQESLRKQTEKFKQFPSAPVIPPFGDSPSRVMPESNTPVRPGFAPSPGFTPPTVKAPNHP